MIVVDASALVEVLLATARGAAAVGAQRGRALFSPGLLDFEVLQALRGLERGAVVTSARAAHAVDDLGRARITRVPAHLLTPRAWALRHNLSAYDAAYVALAERLRCPLLTADRRLAAGVGAASDPAVAVVVV